MFFGGGFSFTNFLINMLVIFLFIMWFWLLITVCSDLFRRRDVSGWGKALWVIFLILLPYLGVFAYLITQGSGMETRRGQEAEQARDEIRRVAGFSVADELGKLDELRTKGKITEQEFATLRAKLIH